MRQPIGPCYFITPWNFPNAMGTRKIGPAIAAGCTMVVKPAQQTPLSMLALAKLLEECGLPAGVLNVVTGSSSSEISKPIIADPRLRKLSFTGSTEVGRKLIAQAADNVLKVSMELGGNAPFLIFDDADLDDAVAGRDDRQDAQHRRGLHLGEPLPRRRGRRRRVRDQARRADGRAEARPRHRGGRRRRPADRRRPSATRSPSWSSDAVEQGARGPGRRLGPRRRRLLLSSRRCSPRSPTTPGCSREEIFGPVAPVKGFASEEEAIAAANDTEYGLVAYVYTSDLKRAFRVCEALETGMIGLNQGMVSNAGAPFGGVKQSGIGREGGNEGIHEYLETKYVAVNL